MNTSNKQSANSAPVDNLESDIFLFNAPIDTGNADLLIHKVRAISKRQENVALILTTSGGDANAAFRIMRFLQRKYKKIILFVFGYCKSAGTLMALGADEIVMSDFGEFGPLDVQVNKSDDLLSSASGLDIQQALDVVGSQAYTMFEDYLLRLLQSSGGLISTRTAADIASSMAVQLLTPISGQIDPLRLGEMNRVMQIAREYGARLTREETEDGIRAIEKLVSEYPAHGFVIDYKEAKDLFKNVREPTEAERFLEKTILGMVRRPTEKAIVEWLDPKILSSQQGEGDDDHSREESSRRDPQGAVSGNDGQSEEDEGSVELSVSHNGKKGE